MKRQETIALYARVSSDRQAEEGSIESQLATLRSYSAEQGYSVKDEFVFVDNGVSGATLNRPALDRLRDRAAQGELDRVLVLCPDRFARKHVHQLILVEEFKRLAVEIEFINHALSDTPEDQLLFQIQSVISEFEREKIMERSRRGKMYRAGSGNVSVLSGAPYGFRYVPKSESGEARYEIVEHEAEVVRRIFQLYGVQQVSINGIAKLLTEEGVASPSGAAHWSRSTVGKMLKNPAYVGKAAYNKHKAQTRQKATKLALDGNGYPKAAHSSRRQRPEREWIYIEVPRIVSEKLFKRVAEQVERNKRFSARNTKRHTYLLSGLLRCTECNYALHGITTKRKNGNTTRSYYKCAGGQPYRHPDGKRLCSSHYIRCDILDDLVWEQTKQLIQNPEVVVQEYSRRSDKKKNQQIDIQELAAQKQKELRRAHTEQERLLDLYQSGAVTLDEINGRLTKIKERIAKIESEHALLRRDAEAKHKQLHVIERFAQFQNAFDHNLDDLSMQKKQDVLRLLVDEVKVDCRTAEIDVKHIVPMQDAYRLDPRRVNRGAIDAQS